MEQDSRDANQGWDVKINSTVLPHPVGVSLGGYVNEAISLAVGCIDLHRHGIAVSLSRAMTLVSRGL